MLSLFYECSYLEYVRIYAIYRVTRAECVIRFLMAASQKYVNTNSISRLVGRFPEPSCGFAEHVGTVSGNVYCETSEWR